MKYKILDGYDIDQKILIFLHEHPSFQKYDFSENQQDILYQN